MFEVEDPGAAPPCWPGSAASRTMPLSTSPASGSAASPTRRARIPAPRARPRRSSSSASGSRPPQIAAFQQPGAQITVGFDHPNYGHMATLPEPVRAALAEDFD